MNTRIRKLPKRPGHVASAGMSMIEVLVAILLLVFGMFGVAAMQATSLRNSQSAMDHTQAVVQTYAMLDRMRANVPQARIGNYNLLTMTCALPDAGTLAQNERREWIQNLQSTLGPAACGQVVCDDVTCVITVRWDDSRATGGSATRTVVTRTRL